MNPEQKTIALIGNPNTGKTTLFNALTGLRQKTGNYPGVTVERKVGRFDVQGKQFMVVDLPGTYALNPKSMDEIITYETLIGRFEYEQVPNIILAVVDASNLDRNLYLVMQAADLGLPVVIALNMTDVAEEKGLKIDVEGLQNELGIPVVPVMAHKGKGIAELKQKLSDPDLGIPKIIWRAPEDLREPTFNIARGWLAEHTNLNEYARVIEALRLINHAEGLSYYQSFENYSALEKEVEQARTAIRESGHNPMTHEILSRYEWIKGKTSGVISRSSVATSITERIDRVVTHKIFGPIVFVMILMVIFQSIFSWSEPFMDLIDLGFATVGSWVAASLPDGLFNSLLVDGIIAGLGGVVIFLPQIMFLFFFISIMESTGYMARAAFVMDGFMTRIGLHGRSVVPLISGFACAIPGIMATRTIESWRDRLITIMVLPFMACSARLPVYALLTAAFIPNKTILGVFSLQGITFFGLYFFGIVTALLAAWVFKQFFPTGQPVPFIMELPTYKMPNLSQTLYQMVERGWIFVKEAGKVIMAISILLWIAASFPTLPQQSIDRISTETSEEAQIEAKIAGEQLRYSLAGRFGKLIEPAIEPLGFDWKIGIALFTSFAAREVVVGTLNTLYSVGGDSEDITTLKEKLKSDTDPETGKPIFTTLVALSLMIFYALAMQCMSTIAIVRRETNSWKWPAIMFTYMTTLAYLSSLLIYQIGSLLGY